jgi:hypothetical protein
VDFVRTDVSEEHAASIIRLLVTAKVPTSSILVTPMMEMLLSYETSALTRTSRCKIPEDDILPSHRLGNLKSDIALTGWALYRRRNAFPVRYELGFCIPDDGIIHSHRHGNLKSYIALTGWALWRRRNVFPVRYEQVFYIPEYDIVHSHRRENLKSYIALID